MGLFSFLSKNKQDSAAGEGEFYSRAEGDARPRTRNTRKSAKSGKAGKADAGGRGTGDDEPIDPVLPEKKRARRRLVGAVALVLAMIIGLPMILDSEPKPMADDIAIQIPSRDKPPVVAPAASVPATAASTSSVPVAASLDPREQVVAMPPVATGTAGAKPPAASIPVSDAVPKNGKPEAKPEAKPESKPEAKPDAKQPEPVRNAASDKQESKPDSKPADKTGDKQVAKLEHKPDQKTEQKDEARAAAILDGKDVDAKQAGDKKVENKAENKAGKFIVQVAALTSKEKITELQGKLSEAGFKPMLQTVPTDAGVTTRVRVGPFASKDEAQSAMSKLDKLGLHGKLLPL